MMVKITKGNADLSGPYQGPINGQTFSINDIKYDNSDLLKKAKEKYHLQPGEDWATGYHFTADYIDGLPTLTIIGLDQQKQFTKIYYDTRSGKEIDAQHKVAYGGEFMGLNLKTKKTVSSHDSMAVRGVTTKNDLVVIWGDKHPTEFNMAHDPFIEISRNNGESWTLLDSKLIINNAWITDESKIIASTNNEIYILGLDNTQKFLLSVNSNITGIDCTTNGKIAFLTEDGFVYSSIDYGMNWTKMKVPELSRAVQINHIGQIFLATNSQKILISNKSAEWINISLPDKLAQVQVINDNILCLFKDNSLRIYNLKLKDWKEVNNGTSISMLLKDHVNFYAFSEETGEVSVIMNGGDATGWTLGNIYKMEKGYLTSVKSSKGNIFLSAVPIYLWKPLK